MRQHIGDCDCEALGDFICEVLSLIYVAQRERFAAAAAERGIPLESLAAAAIAEAVAERRLVTKRANGC